MRLARCASCIVAARGAVENTHCFCPLAVVVAVGTASSARADPAQGLEPGRPEPGVDGAVDEAETSLPAKTQIQFQPSYTFPNGRSRYTAETLFQPILPYHGVLIPDLDVPATWSIARVRLPAQSIQNDQGVSTGIGDLTLLDLAATRVGPLDVGVGFATVFPMATTPALGQGKWQVGPALGVSEERIAEVLKISVLVQNFYSVAGSNQSPDLAYVTVQPFVTLHLPAATFLATDATMTFGWRGEKTTVPVNLGLGRAFGERFVGVLKGWYTLAGDGQRDVKVEVVLNFQR